MIKKDYIVPEATLIYFTESMLAGSKDSNFNDGYKSRLRLFDGGDNRNEVIEEESELE